jgi:uroporphyrinogen-III synthase
MSIDGARRLFQHLSAVVFLKDDADNYVEVMTWLSMRHATADCCSRSRAQEFRQRSSALKCSCLGVIESHACDPGVIDRYMKDRDDCVDVAVFTSIRAVDAFARWWATVESPRRAAMLARMHFFALGSKQCAALQRMCESTTTPVDGQQCADASALCDVIRQQKFTDHDRNVDARRLTACFFCSSRRLPTVPTFFAQHADRVDFTAPEVYSVVEKSASSDSNASACVTSETASNAVSIDEHLLDQCIAVSDSAVEQTPAALCPVDCIWLVFFSPSGVSSFTRCAANVAFVRSRHQARLAAIGPTTARAIETQLGIAAHAVALSPTPRALCDAILSPRARGKQQTSEY